MRIKYCYSSLRKARVLGLSHEYLFFLRLKATGHDHFDAGTSTQTIADLLAISRGSVSQNVSKLIRCGLVTKWQHADGKTWRLNLAGYKAAWRLLGFRPGAYAPRHTFEFTSLSSNTKQGLLDAIVTLELRRSGEKQAYRLKQKLERKIQYHTNTLTESNKHKKEAILRQLQSRLNDGSDEVLLASWKQEPTQNRISCKRIASVIGYRTGNSALKVVKRLERANVLAIKNDRRTVATGVTLSEFLRHHDRRRNQFWKFGNIIENNCNTYSVFPTGSSMPLTARKPL